MVRRFSADAGTGVERVGEDLTHVVILRGGGDLASGVALRLYRAGIRVLITELAQPLAVRRTVSFAEAVYREEITIEGITAHRADTPEHALEILQSGSIPVVIDPPTDIRHSPLIASHILIDARLTKRLPDLGMDAAPLVIGLGPGFVPGENCHAAIETQRGHTLGRVLWDSPPTPDTRQPEGDPRRVLRAPAEGILHTHVEIGEHVEAGQLVAEIAGERITVPFAGVVRGLLHPKLHVTRGTKLGDVDPRDNPTYCYQVSDKALAIGGGVLEAVLTKPEIRNLLWK
ncbi:MAG: EF2563 family selenium-dependent molybdenum hydroxylase system protein [Anaerolineales bacterium]|nr:EF2563 family selenium-dependent molybdenum hydroxylase system protein [Anaerolineales bacterium]